MEEFHSHGEAKLDAIIDANDMICLTMGGMLTEEHINDFTAWADAVKHAMVEVKSRNPHKVLTLIDVRGVSEFDTTAINSLRELMSFNKNYATRTAVFGASYVTKITTELMLVATMRNNMKLFDTREEALLWLNEEQAALSI